MKQKSKLEKSNTRLRNKSTHNNETSKSLVTPNNVNLAACLTLCFVLGYLHTIHIETLFENDKHFSHLSTLERELSFRTESGLYYYYFKILATNQNSSLPTLIKQFIINDARTEHPYTINSLERFNLYPEVVVAFFYRLANSFGWLKKTCWEVNRDEHMPPVESCEGLLEPIYFYSKSIFLLHGFSMGFLFFLCWLLNQQSLSAGLIGCLCYFFNHSEATRVMWTPALRENFSFPFHLLQMISLTYFIKLKYQTIFRYKF
jgi:C-mannosyltransferase DPY19L